MTLRRRGVMGECEARTQGALVFVNTGATEDAAIAPSRALRRHTLSFRFGL
jgi:hypothetical protein